MREILFRGKRVDNGEWAESAYPFGTMSSGAVVHDFDHATIGQYTGLIDKSGKEIFEGDIVRYGDTTHRVVFEQRNGTAYFGLVYGPEETLPFGHYQDLRQITIIGNIYDNLELLEETETALEKLKSEML